MARGRAEALGDGRELGLAKPAAAERAVRDDGNPVLLAPRDHAVLDRALVEVVEDLVARDLAGAGNRERLVEVVVVEVRHAPRADLALGDELVERAERLGEWVRAAPVEEVKIDVIGAQPAQARLARLLRTGVTGVVRQHLRREKDAVAVDR